MLNVSGPAGADPPDIQVGLNSMPFTGHLIQKGIVNLPSLAKAHVQAVGGIVSEPRAGQDLHSEACEAIVLDIQLQLHVEAIREDVGLSLHVLVGGWPAIGSPVTRLVVGIPG